jgi:opacity protein-like surface antigen
MFNLLNPFKLFMKNTFAKVSLFCLLSSSANLYAEKLPFAGRFGQVGIGYDIASPFATGSTSTSRTNTYGVYEIGNSLNFNESISVGYNYVLDPKIRLGIGFTYNIMFKPPLKDVAFVSGNTSSNVGQYLKKNSYDFFIAPGYVVGTDGLAYAKIGLSSSRAQLLGDTINFKGYTVGAGYKYDIDPSMYVFGEVNYSVYGDQTSAPTTLTNGVITNHNITYSNDSKTALIGYGFSF